MVFTNRFHNSYACKRRSWTPVFERVCFGRDKRKEGTNRRLQRRQYFQAYVVFYEAIFSHRMSFWFEIRAYDWSAKQRGFKLRSFRPNRNILQRTRPSTEHIHNPIFQTSSQAGVKNISFARAMQLIQQFNVTVHILRQVFLDAYWLDSQHLLSKPSKQARKCMRRFLLT